MTSSTQTKVQPKRRKSPVQKKITGTPPSLTESLLNEVLEDVALNKKFQESKKDVEHYAQETMDYVRSHPLQSLLIAGGIGFLISTLMKK